MNKTPEYPITLGDALKICAEVRVIAHDQNNLLAAANAAVQMLKLAGPGDEKNQNRLNALEKCVERQALLSRRLFEITEPIKKLDPSIR